MRNLIPLLRRSPYRILTFLFINLNILFAQAEEDTASTHTFWLNAGVGTGKFESAQSLNLSYQYKNYILSIRYGNTGYGGIMGYGLWDHSLLIGLASTPGETFYSIAAGISEVDGNLENKSVDEVTGLALESQLFLRPAKYFGIGFYLFANINSDESFSGGTICLQLGLLR